MIGTALKKILKSRGITNQELASRTGLTPQSISRIVNNRVDPHYRNLLLIAKALEIDVGELHNGDAQDKPPKAQEPMTEQPDRSIYAYHDPHPVAAMARVVERQSMIIEDLEDQVKRLTDKLIRMYEEEVQKIAPVN